MVVAASGHIGEGHIAALGSRGPGGPPQEGDGLGAGAGSVGSEGGGSGSGCDALAHGPGYGVGVVRIVRHIRERVFAVLFRPLGVDRHVLGQFHGGDLVSQLCVGVPAVKDISGSGGNIAGQVDDSAAGFGHAVDLAAAVGVKGQGIAVTSGLGRIARIRGSATAVLFTEDIIRTAVCGKGYRTVFHIG